MTSLAAARSERPRRVLPLDPRAGACLALVVLADLLFHGRGIGISAALFAAATLAAITLTAPWKAGPKSRWRLAALPVVAALPLVEHVDALSLAFAAAGLGAFALLASGHWHGSLAIRLAMIADLYLAGPWRLAASARRRFKLAHATSRARSSIGHLVAWIVPIALGGIFLLLFASANPLIDRWLAAFDPGALLRNLSAGRIALWIAVLGLTAPLLHVTLRKAKPSGSVLPHEREERPTALRDLLLSDAAILRSLALFNLIFGLQSAMDLTYLWGGVALPDGMNYATYAHRGAYPLIATALLAAGFVLLALRPGSSAEGSRAIRALVYLWIAQTVLLVISSILRLDLYVAVYSLTRLRLAAFIWMVIVATGLVLIVVRIARGAGNGWLVQANLVAVGLILYGCSLTNAAALIADYNVEHAREISGQGVALDLCYLSRLGPQAIPALDRFIAQRSLAAVSGVVDLPTHRAQVVRDRLAHRAEARRGDWRRWTFRNERLWRYLVVMRDAIPPPSLRP
jgi:hypothetical protein